jgi:BlaI family transcriptional regulator, penicillinase repressor
MPTRQSKAKVRAVAIAGPISDAEAEVMQVLWSRGDAEPASTEDISQALAERQDWQMATVKTLLNRLLNKGAISAQQDGRRYLYSPVLQRTAWVSAQSQGLLDRWFDGRLAPLVAHFGAHRKLKAADIKALKKLIADYENE